MHALSFVHLGTAPARSERTPVAQPAALLKRPKDVDSSARGGASENDVLLLHSNSQIEYLLLQEGESTEAGDGDVRKGISTMDAVDITRGGGGGDGVGGDNGDAVKPVDLEGRQPAKPAECVAMPAPSSDVTFPNTNVPGMPILGATIEKVRSRPWAIQSFVTPKGPLAW